MRLTAEEKKICKEYSKRGADGLYRCNECPLVINKRFCICKKNISKKDYKENWQ